MAEIRSCMVILSGLEPMLVAPIDMFIPSEVPVTKLPEASTFMRSRPRDPLLVLVGGKYSIPWPATTGHIEKRGMAA